MATDSSNRAQTPTRRALTQGALWSAPAVAIATAAPAVASTPVKEPQTLTINGTGSSALSTTTVAFACTTVVTYTVTGGSGGADVPATFTGAGKGAELKGTVTVPAGTTLTLVAGGVGDTKVSNNYLAGAAYVAKGGKGYGSGGDSGPSASRTGSGGGGGSAILIGTTPLVVAGGGGGSYTRNANYTVTNPANPFTASLNLTSLAGSCTGTDGRDGQNAPRSH